MNGTECLEYLDGENPQPRLLLLATGQTRFFSESAKKFRAVEVVVYGILFTYIYIYARLYIYTYEPPPKHAMNQRL